MDLLWFAYDLIMHLDRYLGSLLAYFGAWTYLVLFLIIFCETGLVVTPILPGDSLLFALGAFAANPHLKGPLEVEVLLVLLSIAAIAGDTVNYAVGKYVGPKVFHYEKSRFFKKEYLDRTHAFYEKYGPETIVLARFVPIVRTFAPFVAGIGAMTYARFILYNIAGGIGWICFFVLGGYFFGNLPVVKNNFTLVLLAIVILSVMPGVYEYLRARAQARREAQRS